ncbi:MAG: hypothetical protein ACK5JM_04040 [Rhodoblastus sp.]
MDAQSRIVVGKGRAGKNTVLRYDDGCQVSLRPGQVYTVPDISPCRQATQQQQQQQPAQQPATEASTFGGISTPVVVGGVLVAGAIAGGVVAATSNNNNNNWNYWIPTTYVSP